MLLEIRIPERVLRHDHRRYVAAPQRLADDLRVPRYLPISGTTQHEAAAVFNVAHGSIWRSRFGPEAPALDFIAENR